MCDTFVALAPYTADGSVIFAKNSDRPRGEAQSIRHYPAKSPARGSALRCTYIEIPESDVTFEILLSQPDWMWGGEMGANGNGVVIGNEAVWTREKMGGEALLGMDLLRLGLERGATAIGALEVITGLLEEFGQGGACAEGDPTLSYHNSFLIADANGAWVLESAGRLWAAEKIDHGARNISNGLTIGREFDMASTDLAGQARERGFYSGHGEFDFTQSFSPYGADDGLHSRQGWGSKLLDDNEGAITPRVMMEILRDHEGGICMHGGFETTASMVSELKAAGTSRHWLTGAAHPCRSEFKEMDFPKRN